MMYTKYDIQNFYIILNFILYMTYKNVIYDVYKV